MLKKSLTVALCTLACLVGSAKTKTHEQLKYSTTAVKAGVWSTQFTKCKKLAVKRGVPLVVLWVNPGCAHCRELCHSLADTPSFNDWLKKSGNVFVLGIGTNTSTGKKVKAFAKSDKKTTLSTFPFCAVYLNPLGTTSPTIKGVFTGNGLSATGFRRKARSIYKKYAKITLKKTSGGAVEPVMWQKIGKKVKLRAISNRGYRFVGWFDKKGKRVSTKANYQIKVKKSVLYRAKFKKEI